MLEMRTTQCEYELSDESGYKFKITAKQHQEGGWKGGWYADVTLSADGMNSAEGAVMRLLSNAEQFVRMLREARDEQP